MTPSEPFHGNYVDGRFRRPSVGAWILSEDPGDLDRPLGRVRSSLPSVDDAVEAARRAQPRWHALRPDRREVYFDRFQSLLLRHAERLAATISRETGKPLSESRAEARSMAEKVDLTREAVMALAADTGVSLDRTSRAVVRHRPLGVAAVIGPFNVPGHLPNGQIIPALLTGNAVVFKPSEKTPFTGQLMAELWDRAGLPPGVFNLVQGGGDVGAALAARAGVDGVFFTGSLGVGRRLAALCAQDPSKLLALEMGGKNAALVLHDAPMELAARACVDSAFATTGQRCSCASRILVHRRAAKKFLENFLPLVDAVRSGYFDEGPTMGPLIDGAAVRRFLKAQRDARRLGYRTLREGRELRFSRRGRYVSPSVHLWEGPPPVASPLYWDEELFAPDVAVYVCRDEDEMVRIHNASRFGLAAAVFSNSRDRFEGLRERLEAGVIHWNRGTAMSPGMLPFGGVKASGNHRPAGFYAVRAFVTPVGSVETQA